jgi:lysozyme
MVVLWRWRRGYLVPEYRMSEKGVRMLTNFEAMVLHVYPDQGGLPTVCVGHVVKPEDHAWIDDGVTVDECRAALTRDLRRFEDEISRTVKVKLSGPMIDALVSLVFNIGEINWERSSALQLLNAGDYSGAADAITLWRFVRVKQKDGSWAKKPILLGRREAEATLFRSGILEVHGASYSEEPSLDDLLSRATAAEFSRFDLVPDHPPIENDTEGSGDALSDDGRIVALPPDEEAEAA